MEGVPEEAFPSGVLAMDRLIHPTDSLTEDQKRQLARWRGEAAKAWWQELTDEGRATIMTLPADQLFGLGWQAARSTPPPIYPE